MLFYLSKKNELHFLFENVYNSKIDIQSYKSKSILHKKKSEKNSRSI